MQALQWGQQSPDRFTNLQIITSEKKTSKQSTDMDIFEHQTSSNIPNKKFETNKKARAHKKKDKKSKKFTAERAWMYAIQILTELIQSYSALVNLALSGCPHKTTKQYPKLQITDVKCSIQSLTYRFNVFISVNVILIQFYLGKFTQNDSLQMHDGSGTAWVTAI